MTNNYWDNFYNQNNKIEEPSSFCKYVIEYLNKNNKKDNKIIDLGCGNCRDLNYFEYNKFKIDGIDLYTTINKPNVLKQDMVSYKYTDYDIYYSRFSLHALELTNINKFLENVHNCMNNGSLFFIETRSIKGTKYEDLEFIEYNFKSGIGDYHNRTLFNFNYLLKLLDELNFNIIYKQESNGLSIFNNEDPYLIRLILQKKKNVSNNIHYILREQVLNNKYVQYINKKELNEIIKRLEKNNIHYVVFFGNLIGLLRHKTIFIPWDDDIDLIVDKKNLSNIKNIFSDYKQNDACGMLQLIKNGKTFIDFFYDHHLTNKVNIYDYNKILGYNVPNNYINIFNKWYESTDYLTNCMIYNHKFNNRWDSKNPTLYKKINININDCNKILSIIQHEYNSLNIKYLNFIKKLITENSIHFKFKQDKLYDNLNKFLYEIIKKIDINKKYSKIILYIDEFLTDELRKYRIDNYNFIEINTIDFYKNN